jgi:ribosome-associated protein
MAAMGPEESIRVTGTVSVPRSEIEVRTSRSSGPGGQHAQKSETRVEARFRVLDSTALTERQKQRVVARAGPVLHAVAQDERSQLRNRALRVERPRKATAPPPGAVERRLETKRRRSRQKELRRPPDGT